MQKIEKRETCKEKWVERERETESDKERRDTHRPSQRDLQREGTDGSHVKDTHNMKMDRVRHTTYFRTHEHKQRKEMRKDRYTDTQTHTHWKKITITNKQRTKT